MPRKRELGLEGVAQELAAVVVPQRETPGDVRLGIVPKQRRMPWRSGSSAS